MVGGTKKVRSVSAYLTMLERANKSPRTIKTYYDSLDFFARFLDVPLEELHNHLTVDNLMDYIDSDRMKGLAPNSRRTALASISRYMKTNGVEFDELEYNVVKTRKSSARNDKPLELKTAQMMMDLADERMKAVVMFLISTGCRINETSKILLSDVRGTIVNIRPEIAKGGHGGKCFLTAEAREYLDIWLNKREEWIADADWRVKNIGRSRPKNDQRLFASSCSDLGQRFGELYDAVDGETVPIAGGKKRRRMVTPHSCRAYFRTRGAKSMGPDLAEGIMRHTGYLSAEYFRMSPEEREQRFHAGEDALYITRRDRRMSESIQDIQSQKIKDLEERVAMAEKREREKDNIKQEENNPVNNS